VIRSVAIAATLLLAGSPILVAHTAACLSAAEAGALLTELDIAGGPGGVVIRPAATR